LWEFKSPREHAYLGRRQADFGRPPQATLVDIVSRLKTADKAVRSPTEAPKEPTLSYFLKRPDRTRRTYAVAVNRGSRPLTADQLAIVAQINADLRAGKLGTPEAEAAALKLVADLSASERFRHAAHTFLPDNERILEDYWNEEYGRRPRRDRRSAYNRLKRAVAALGAVPLRTTSGSELQRILGRLPAKKQRAVVPALNQVLRFLSRKDRLYPVQEESRALYWLTYDEAVRVAAEFPPPWRYLILAAFGTGMRVGELFAVVLEDVQQLPDGNHFLIVRQQMLDDGRLEGRKNRQRIAEPVVVPRCLDALIQWAAIPFEEKRELRQAALGLAPKVRLACVKAKTRHVGPFHVLRHSYAQYLLGCGYSADQMAKMLGDSTAVVEKLYGASRGESIAHIQISAAKMK
jgi:integrase